MQNAAASMKTQSQSASHKDLANSIRALAMDAVEKANSGHPGMPMGMADVATVLFRDFLKFDPASPHWADRDRFILSAGHGSMLLYALLYLTGYKDMTLDEIKRFRQLGAITAGHPEFGHASGVETTTGPLGQGIANSVGFALAERMMAARYGYDIVDHYTYVIAGDGCLMEGISHEAIGLAGHLKLNKLIVLFDDNGITIDGSTALSVTEDTPKRFEASGWNVISIDGHNEKQIHDAIKKAKSSDKPTLIACKTTIAFGAPTKAGSEKSHGSPLGAEEIKGAREKLGWPHPAFEIPDAILHSWRQIGQKGVSAHHDWQKKFAAKPTDVKAEFERVMAGDLPASYADAVQAFKKQLAEKQPNEATRKSSENALEVINIAIPEMIGGSADLTGSNNTKTKTQKPVSKDDYSGRYLYYGIREHGMAAAMNGLALHGGFIPYSGTFLVFTDYCRPSIRLSALMQQRVIYVMTHDSIGLGEDGPTHQPVEHLASLRAMPNLHVMRPCDSTEALECWQLAIESKQTPTVLSLTRQNLPHLRKDYVKENLCAKGAYIISKASGEATVTLIATGSEVSLAVDAQKLLAENNVAANVVSMPCAELFDAQPKAYRDSVLGSGKRIAIEAAIGYGWEKYIGDNGVFIGMKSFGASAPAKDLYKHFGITAEAVVEAVLKQQ